MFAGKFANTIWIQVHPLQGSEHTPWDTPLSFLYRFSPEVGCSQTVPGAVSPFTNICQSSNPCANKSCICMLTM